MQDRGLRDPGRPGIGSRDLQIFRRGPATVCHELVFDLLAFIERTQAGALDSGDVNEHILVAARRLDEPLALSRIKPLDGALLHRLSPNSFQMSAKTRSRHRTPRAVFAIRATSQMLGESKAILSARQHQPDGPNPIATPASPTNAAQPWLHKYRCSGRAGSLRSP